LSTLLPPDIEQGYLELLHIPVIEIPKTQ